MEKFLSMTSITNLESDITIYELCTIISLYLLSKGLDFNYSKSKSSDSNYFKVKTPKIEIRVSNHWQENCNEIQVITIFDLAKIFEVLK